MNNHSELISIDIELLADSIESAQEKFHIDTLSIMYFSTAVNPMQQQALNEVLSVNPALFENCGNGYFRKLSIEERKRKEEILHYQQIEQEFATKVNDLLTVLYQKNKGFTVNPFLPDDDNYSKLQLELLTLVFNAQLEKKKKPNFDNAEVSIHAFKDALVKFIYKPDKQTKFFKLVQGFTKDLGISILEYFHQIGLVKNIPHLLLQAFLHDNEINDFSNLSSEFKNYQFMSTLNLELNNEINVFSIDGETTTEIDDAFSVKKLESGYRIGIHIAAPAVDKSLLDFVTQNISTIYFPSDKITMLPSNIIQEYSLIAGKTLPVVSIYFNLDADFNVIDYTSTLEAVKIEQNLRIESLEKLFNIENIDLNNGYQYEEELKILYKFANKLEEKRGKPSVNTLILDYNFILENNRINMVQRVRGNPIDKVVSELMILANCSWGRMLTNAFIPAIYRVKQPGSPVKMTLNAASHTGLNVDYYTWATSPLRRSSDFINQYQIINLILGTKKYLKPLDYEILNVVDSFDKVYARYLNFQDKMELFWSLAYFIQENISEITGTFTYKTNVQLHGVPIIIDTKGLINPKPSGEKIKVVLHNINLINLTFDFKILE